MAKIEKNKWGNEKISRRKFIGVLDGLAAALGVETNDPNQITIIERNIA
ncbi:MAG: hypothetical protein NWF14_08905 [Candidatus Bathyarchaeota archaeon]|nr:hypothetical protein [Candidatus Bathyarchaeota archaeon]